MNRIGQGALEYLLLIGGAVLIAAIVITLVISTGQQGITGADRQSSEALCLQNSTSAAACTAASPSVKMTTAGYDCGYRTADATCKLCLTGATGCGATPPVFTFP